MSKPYFIEYYRGIFVNANDITELQIKKGKISFLSRYDLTGRCIVSDDLASTFMNHLQAYNGNIANVSDVWLKQMNNLEL